MKTISTFLMFVGKQAGKAEEAIRLYTAVFPNSGILEIERYQSGENEPEDHLKQCRFNLNGIEFRAMDSSLNHNFNFTPSMSLFVECTSEKEIDEVFQALVKDGEELMPLDNYGFSKKFAWFNDKYGVSWQLNWPG